MGDGITITGGYTAAETDTMRRAADALRDAAGRLDDARLHVARSRVALRTGEVPWAGAVVPWSGADVATTRWGTGASVAVAVALDDVAAADGAVLRASGALEDLARAVLRAARLYEDHDDLAVRLLDAAAPAGIQVLAAELVPLVPLWAHGGTSVERVAGAVSWLFDGAARVRQGDDLRVEEITQGTVAGRPDLPLPNLAAPGSVEGALRTLEVPNKAGDGVLAVQRIGDGPDARYVVLLPGTQDWNVVGDGAGDFANPRDLTSDLDLVGGRASDYTDEVAEVLRRVVPEGASVVVVGHSLGGIAATRVVTNPALRRRYRFTGLVTAGAPSGGIRVPDETLTLNVENARELVSALDPGPNPPGPRHVVVHASGDDDVVRDALDGAPYGGGTHGLAVHAAVLAEARARHDPALDRTLAELDASLGAGTPDVATRTWYFRGERGGMPVVAPGRSATDDAGAGVSVGETPARPPR
ncbi:hypothetical protein GCM10023221_26780 [Luteimicrobium xylanilyticum]|uniref:Fungal lipase-like domain-containing protein n=1 Tax=Luteimicrobium xylanilyticum TaxID=1133546 RepID=A0A5P9QH63_9MICO|nr:hypothetical protein [Luteimicrobium xylanilyticum]QFU99805.1 hypothetical protein KDY119_03341 [Luteimicrobium xylanilyticum]